MKLNSRLSLVAAASRTVLGGASAPAHADNASDEPSPAEITRKSIQPLQKNPKGFCLIVGCDRRRDLRRGLVSTAGRGRRGAPFSCQKTS